MVTIVGRDEAWSARAMATLFQEAQIRNLVPVRWELGFFVLRDLIKASQWPRDWRIMHWRQIKPDTIWGCEPRVVCLNDYVALIATDGNEIHRIVGKER